MEIKIGSGNYIVSGIKRKGKTGVEITKAINHGRETDSLCSTKEILKHSKVLTILFENIPSARMFQDQVNAACLRMNRYIVENDNG